MTIHWVVNIIASSIPNRVACKTVMLTALMTQPTLTVMIPLIAMMTQTTLAVIPLTALITQPSLTANLNLVEMVMCLIT